jgi:putative MFS transporter
VRGPVEEAEKTVTKLLVRRPQYPTTVTLARAAGGRASGEQGGASFAALFNSDNRRATIFASVPWFLQDLGTYGIGIFTPTILAAALGGPADHIRSLGDLISDAILAAKGSAIINVLLIVGIVFAVVLADRLGRIKLQIFGFIGCAVGLLIASFSIDFAGSTQIALIFVGFMLFSFMTNIGPNAQTYLLAGEVFPTRVRGMGAGFAAAFAKIGAVMTAFLFPILLAAIGTRLLLYGLVVSSLLGAAVTWLYRIETNGVKLDRISHQGGWPRCSGGCGPAGRSQRRRWRSAFGRWRRRPRRRRTSCCTKPARPYSTHCFNCGCATTRASHPGSR